LSQLDPAQGTGAERRENDRGRTVHIDIDSTRSAIVNGCLIAIAIAAVPTVAASLYRSVDIGWSLVHLLHLVLAATVIAAALGRHRLSYRMRANVLISATMLVGVAGVLAFGQLGNGRVFLLGSILIAAMLFGFAAGLIALLCAVGTMIGTYVLMKTGSIHFDADAQILATSLSSWITSIASLALLAAAIGVPLVILLRQLDRALRQSESDRDRLSQAHKTSEDFFSKAFHSSPLVLAVTDPVSGQFHDVNQACLDISGYTRDEFLQTTSVALGIWVNIDDRRIFVEKLKRDGFVRDMDVTLRSKDGRLNDVLLSADLIATQDGDRILIIGQDITRLKDVARIKSEFISIVSHELRTPLTSIVGALKLASHEANIQVSSEQRNQLLSIALKNSTRLSEIVNDLLDLDKLQSGAMVFELQPVDLAALAVEAMEQSRTFASECGVRFVPGSLTDTIHVHGDPSRLNQVIVNILSNAAKFSPRDGEIIVSVRSIDGYGRVEIADRGPGIPNSFKAQLFDRFTQADSSTTRKVQGSGLGLHICKSIVDAHHGRIDFRPNDGGGTVFFFDIPLLGMTANSSSSVGRPTMAAH